MAENEIFHRLRRENLTRLIQERCDGNVTDFARKHGIQQSRLNRYVSTRAAPTPMGYIAARSIEQEVGLEPRYLDRLPDGSLPEIPLLTVRPSTVKAESAAQHIISVAESIPAMRRRIVSTLVAQVIESPENDAYKSLLREELERILS